MRFNSFETAAHGVGKPKKCLVKLPPRTHAFSHLLNDAGPGLVVRSLGKGGQVVFSLLFALEARGVLARQPAVD